MCQQPKDVLWRDSRFTQIRQTCAGVTLGKPLAVFVHHQRQMKILDWLMVAQRVAKQDLPRCRVEKIIAPHDAIDPARVIVHHLR